MILMMVMMVVIAVVTEVVTGWRPRFGKRAQRGTALKLIASHLGEIQN